MIYEQLQMDGLGGLESDPKKLPSYPQVFPVSHTALREKVAAIVTSVTCGERLQECSEKLSRAGSSVKIRPVYSQERIIGISGGCSMTLPRWGILLHGEYGALATSERRTSAIGCSLWRTPMAAERWENQKQKHLSEQVAYTELRGGGVLYPGDVHHAVCERREANESNKQYACGARNQEGRENKPCGTDSGSNTLSDAYGARKQQPCREQQKGGERACNVCKTLSDATGDKLGVFGCAGETAGAARGGSNQRGRTERDAGGEWWEVEPDVGRVAHGVPARVDRLRGLGNAVVPYQALPIFDAIAEYELFAQYYV